MVDIATLEYDVELITETGAKYGLNDVLLSLTWEEQDGELAQRATLSVANLAIGSSWLCALMKINCIINIYGKWGAGRQLLFEGTIWEWQYTSASARECTVTAYDRLIKLQQSDDFFYFEKGRTTQSILEEICGAWGVPVSYKWDKSLTHEKTVFSGIAISDMLITLLDEVKQKTGDRYITYWRDGNLQITGYGTNNVIYKFTNDTTISTVDKLTINNLVTRVRIIGKDDKKERDAVPVFEDGDLRYGTLQKIIRRDSDKNIDTAVAEAKALLKERGKPESSTTVTTLDLPFLRKGDKIEMAAGNLLGEFYVVGVSHNATQKQMTMTIVEG